MIDKYSTIGKGRSRRRTAGDLGACCVVLHCKQQERPGRGVWEKKSEAGRDGCVVVERTIDKGEGLFSFEHSSSYARDNDWRDKVETKVRAGGEMADGRGRGR